MVPKVNSGANVYGVLQYNRIKVEAGEGRILYMQGIPERSDGRFSIEECAEAFGTTRRSIPVSENRSCISRSTPRPKTGFRKRSLRNLPPSSWNAWDMAASPMSSFCTKTSHGDTCTSSR